MAMARTGGLPRSCAPSTALLAIVLVASSFSACMARSYLGCFSLSRWQYSYKSYSGSWSVESCSAKCESLSFPLVGMGESDTACMCGVYPPNGDSQLDDGLCMEKVHGSFALHYYKTPCECPARPAAAAPEGFDSL